MNNPIIEEIRQARAALAEEHGYDLKRINEWAREQTEARRKSQNRSKVKVEEQPIPADSVVSSEVVSD
ncbi:MAG: hypothetical protein GXX91_11345 [Verrucomicrobiaceae bacterium]|nr:hypothetical protein [Verrucomicrobiaceae bacterium]